MANNYLQFSSMIPTVEGPSQQFILDKLSAAVGDDDGVPCQWEAEGEAVWIYTDEWGDVVRVAELVCEWQQKFTIQSPWSLTYAETCSKPRLDEFTGGAVVCYKGEAHYMNAVGWAEAEARRMISRN
jgi:hypothetical protein